MLQRNFSQTEEQPQPLPSKKSKIISSNRIDHSKKGYKEMTWYNFSIFEKVTITFTFVLMAVLAICLISAKVDLANSQNNLQNVNSNVTRIHNSNTNLKQEISELQNSNRLHKIAYEQGLSQNTKNIRNVGK